MAKQSKNQDKPRIEKLVKISRVAKVVKGGKNLSFSALSVIGDGNGSIGYGLGKALEVPEAIRKANADAEKRMVRIPLREGRTVHHDSIGNFGAGRVIIRSAPAGTGIIAGGSLRAVFEALGVSDIVCKSVGTTNPHNMVKAAFDALLFSTSPRQVAARRNKKISDLVSRRDGNVIAAVDENNE